MSRTLSWTTQILKMQSARNTDLKMSNELKDRAGENAFYIWQCIFAGKCGSKNLRHLMLGGWWKKKRTNKYNYVQDNTKIWGMVQAWDPHPTSPPNSRASLTLFLNPSTNAALKPSLWLEWSHSIPPPCTPQGFGLCHQWEKYPHTFS